MRQEPRQKGEAAAWEIYDTEFRREGSRRHIRRRGMITTAISTLRHMLKPTWKAPSLRGSRQEGKE